MIARLVCTNSRAFRAMTFRQWNQRSCQLANALLGLGLAKGDRVAVLAYNRVEWAEIYAATDQQVVQKQPRDQEDQMTCLHSVGTTSDAERGDR